MTQAALILPAFFLAEIALSFLGVGLQEPEPSLGNLLTAASDITQLARQPLAMLSPAVVIFLSFLQRGFQPAAKARVRGLGRTVSQDLHERCRPESSSVMLVRFVASSSVIAPQLIARRK